MEILLAKQAGFCFGVKRATHMAFEAAEKGGETYTLGPIIHSPQVVEKLEKMGVHVLEDISTINTGTIIIRSHGVTAQEIEEATHRDLKILDATCPFVKKAQEYVKYLSTNGYEVVVVGDADHPEVQGIVSYATGNVHVVSSSEEAAKLPKMRKIGIVAQTTLCVENLKTVVSACLEKGRELRVFHTICDATSVRQDEAKELAHKAGCMIVIGGFNSANTKRLVEVCAEIQPKTHHIEIPQQIDPAWFVGVEKVGITAGASTPKWIIDEVLEYVKKINSDKKY